MIIELANCEHTLLEEISNKKINQRGIAQTYALAMRSSESIDWTKVNAAIIERWSASGMKRIKTMAWSGSCFEEATDETETSTTTKRQRHESAKVATAEGGE